MSRKAAFASVRLLPVTAACDYEKQKSAVLHFQCQCVVPIRRDYTFIHNDCGSFLYKASICICNTGGHRYDHVVLP